MSGTIKLKSRDDLLGKVLGGGVALKVLGSVFWAGGNGVQHGLLNLGGVVVQAHVSQHHNGGEKQGSWVSKTLTSNVWSRAVDGLEDGDLVTHVTRWGQPKTTNETGAQIRHDVTVEIWHHHHAVLVLTWVSDHLQTGVVDQFGVNLDIWVVLADVLDAFKEQTIAILHEGGLVDDQDLWLANGSGVLKGITRNPRGGLSCDKLDGLNDTWNNGVLDTGILALSVLSNQDGVDVLVGGLVANHALAWTDVGKQTEGLTQSKVHGLVALANWGSQWTLQCNLVLLDGLNRVLWEGGLAVDERGSDINWLPINRNVGSLVNVLDSLGNLDTNTITLNQVDSVMAIRLLGASELGNRAGVHSSGRTGSSSQHGRSRGQHCFLRKSSNKMESYLEVCKKGKKKNKKG